MLESYWKLAFDPFSDSRPNGVFVPLPSHVEAVARLRHAIERADRHAALIADAGMGKTRVLHETLTRSRSARTRIVRLPSPPDRAALHHDLARALGYQGKIDAGAGPAWRALEAALRVVRLQNIALVIAIDTMGTNLDRGDFERIEQLADHTATRLTLIRLGRNQAAVELESSAWELTLGLPPLTRDEAAFYTHAKLTAAGGDAAIFSERAVTRLHALARGNPRGLDRLASLALRAAALRKSPEITPDLIETIADACQVPDAA